MYADFNEFRRHHPWVGGDTVKPKSVVRDLFERAMTFGEYIDFYGLKNSEGAVLRYLSDVYKGLIQNVPVEAGSDELDEIVHWLGALVRQVDSSLLDEWERLQNPDGPDPTAIRPGDPVDAAPTTITSDARAFRTMVRNEAFRWVEHLARRRRPANAEAELDVAASMSAYWDEYDGIDVGGDARHVSRFDFDPDTGRIEQTLHDPDGNDDWRLVGTRRPRRLTSRGPPGRGSGRDRVFGVMLPVAESGRALGQPAIASIVAANTDGLVAMLSRAWPSPCGPNSGPALSATPRSQNTRAGSGPSPSAVQSSHAR